VSRADDASADIVLTVEEDNGTARALYIDHHFLEIDGRGQTIAMRRRVRASLSESDTPQAGSDDGEALGKRIERLDSVPTTCLELGRPKDTKGQHRAMPSPHVNGSDLVEYALTLMSVLSSV
jgi:hypothetical protein